MKPLKIGLIGTGFIGRRHARIIHEQPESELVACADVIDQRVREISNRHGAVPYTDYREMIEKEDLDGVFITTSDDAHRAPVETAAENGLDIFLEKPMASTLEDADAIIESCSKASVRLMVGYVLRYDPVYIGIKKALDSGDIGRFLSACARRHNSIDTAVETVKGRVPVTHWLMVHDVDQILWYTGAKITKVYASEVRGRVYDAVGMADSVWSLLTLDNGGMAAVESGWALNEGRFDCSMDLMGTGGSIYSDYVPMNLSRVNESGWEFPDTRLWPEVNGKISGPFVAEGRDFLHMLHDEDLESPIPGEVGRLSLEVSLAAQESIASGEPVRL